MSLARKGRTAAAKETLLLTERNVAHRRKNPVDDQLLELLLTGES